MSFSIDALALQHNYLYDEDFGFNSVGCPDHCDGCGSCDHFPPLYAKSDTRAELTVIVNKCKKCHESYSYLKKYNDDEHINKIIINNTTNICSSCECDDFGKYYYNTVALICDDCHGPPASNNHYRIERCQSTSPNYFECCKCNKKYKVNNVGDIRCAHAYTLHACA